MYLQLKFVPINEVYLKLNKKTSDKKFKTKKVFLYYN